MRNHAYEQLLTGLLRHLAQGKASYKKILRPLIEALRPQSVVDFGAGAGTWLAAAKDLGVERVLGIDGPWSQGRHRLVEENEFREVNLEDALPNVGRFDLAISLEVLEHITPAAGERAVQCFAIELMSSYSRQRCQVRVAFITSMKPAKRLGTAVRSSRPIGVRHRSTGGVARTRYSLVVPPERSRLCETGIGRTLRMAGKRSSGARRRPSGNVWASDDCARPLA